MTVLKPVKISFFGVGCKLLVGTFNDKDWQELNLVAEQLNMKLTSAIFDPSFYELIINCKIHSISDLGNKYKLTGLTNSYKSLIQIQIYNKRRRNIQYSELLNSRTLFPLYNIRTIQNSLKLNERTLIVYEEEIGLFSSYIVNTVPFLMENLVFEITNVKVEQVEPVMEMISALYYNDRMLVPKHGDGLVSKQYALVLEQK